MKISLPELHEGRDGETELYKLVNQMRRAMLALDTDVASIPIVPYFSSDSDGDGTTTDSDSNTAAIATTAMAQARFWLSTANPSFPFGVDMSALGSGVLKQTVSGGISTPGLVTISTGIAYANPTMTAWLSTGIAGGQSAIGGTGASENLTLSSTTNGTKGKILFGTSGYDEVNNRLGIGTSSPSYALEVANGSVSILRANSGANPGVYVNDTSSIPGYLPGPNFAFSVAGGAADYVGLDFNARTAGAVPFITLRRVDVQYWTMTVDSNIAALPNAFHFRSGNAVGTDALVLSTAGNVVAPSLAAGGIVKAIVSPAGQLAIASAADVAGAITWPAAKDVLFSTGTSTAPSGSSAWQFDSGSGNIALMGAVIRTNFNLGGPDFSGNWEGIVESWNANVWSLKSQKGGTGTVRAMQIDATTATLTLNGATLTLTGTNTNVTASTQVAIYTSIGTAPDILMSATQTDHRASLTVASAAGAAWNGIKFGDSTLTLTLANHVTNTTGVNMVTMGGGVLISSASALTVDFAATVAITAGPIAAGSAVITNSYGLWLQTLSRFDGNGTHVWELPADATVAGAQTGRIPIKVGGATVYLHYFNG